MPIDSSKIHIFRTTITTPNPTTDPVIAIENSINSSSGNWSETIGGWPSGRWYVYAVAFDLAGNESNPSTLQGPIYSFDSNNFTASNEKWKIGEYNQIKIGSTLSGGGS